MDGNNGKIQRTLPSLPDYPGISSKDISSAGSSLDGLSEQAKNKLINSLEKRIDYESACESNRHKEEKGRQHLAFASLGAIIIIVVSAFLYSGMTKDKTLSEKVINTMLGVLGGGGAVAIACVSKQS